MESENNPQLGQVGTEVVPGQYYGKMCAEHPELNGLRVRGRYLCIECLKESKKRARAARIGRARSEKVGALTEVIHRFINGRFDELVDDRKSGILWPSSFVDLAIEIKDGFSKNIF
jgi:hypothetical protein